MIWLSPVWTPNYLWTSRKLPFGRRLWTSRNVRKVLNCVVHSVYYSLWSLICRLAGSDLNCFRLKPSLNKNRLRHRSRLLTMNAYRKQNSLSCCKSLLNVDSRLISILILKALSPQPESASTAHNHRFTPPFYRPSQHRRSSSKVLLCKSARVGQNDVRWVSWERVSSSQSFSLEAAKRWREKASFETFESQRVSMAQQTKILSQKFSHHEGNLGNWLFFFT